MSFPQFGEIIQEEQADFPIFGEIIEDDQVDISDKPPFNTKTPLKETGRHAARTVSRITESLAGLPGDILRSAQLGAKGLEKGATKIREKIGLEPKETGIKKPGIFGSEELKELSQSLFGDVVKPNSPTEKLIDDIISDSAVLALPIKGRIPFIRSLGTSFAANLSKKLAEESGVRPGGQEAVKMGAFLISGLVGKGNVKKYWKEQYKLAQEALPENAKIDVFGLSRNLENIEKNLSKGISTPSKSFVQKPIDEIQKKIATGRAKVSDLIQMKRDINELRSKLYTEVPGKQNIKYAQGKINDVAGALDKEIEKYGKGNPEFLKHYKAGDEAFAGFHQSKKVLSWIKRQISKYGKGSVLLAEAVFPPLIPTTALGLAGIKGGEFLTRLTRNPTIRKFYLNMVKDAVKENKYGFIKNLRQFEKEAKKSDPDIFDELTRQNRSQD